MIVATARTTMKAVVQTGYGSPDVLELRDVPRPPVGEDDVLVRVRAASLHPDVWHVVSGRPWVIRLIGAGLVRPNNPIPGTDAAGIVESVGTGVSRFKPGDEVFGLTLTRHEWTNGGAFAEYVAVQQDALTPKPSNVTFEHAASVPTSGYIALLNLRGGRGIRPGQTALVNGAAGGVGAIAVQLLKSYGARVTGVDGPDKLEMLHTLGADDVIDYTREDFTCGGRRYDFIFDVPGNQSFAECRRALEPDGRYVLIGHEGYGASGKRVLGLIPRFFTLVLLSIFQKQLRLGREWVPSRQEAVAVLGELLAAGTITPIIDRTYPLSAVRDALRHVMSGETRGKVILCPE